MSKDEEKEKEWPSVTMYSQHPSLRKLEPLEKQYLLSVERGDVVRVTRLLQLVHKNPSTKLDINCKDPVGRSATLMAIDNENLEMLEILLDNDVESRDALLHAINAEYVEAVDLLLEHEEAIYKEGEPHSWEKVDRDISTFTPEITPLILAAHKDNYEILKILLDRGATLPMPHDVRCKCQDCLKAMEEDCLCHSRSRINAYRALSSPSLICLSSIDPILTAFELSWELRRLSMAENEFKEDYVKLRSRCQDFATALLDHARSSRELEMVLNYDPMRPPYQHGEHMPLARLEMALKYKQKKFVAHPNVQQLLTTLWYDGLPGFRRQNPISQLWTIIKIGALFPFYSVIYMTFPNTNTGRLVKKPFFKFIMHSFSYLFFLLLLILASQRVETVIAQWFGSEEMQQNSTEALKKQRGQPPTILETTILLYIIAHIWQETREVWTKGIINYFHNLWNFIDFTRNGLYVGTAGMRLLAYFQAQAEISENPMAVYIPRETWNPYDPMLIADGLFAAGNIFAALKLVHIFSINPYLGPLQISLGRMVIDIIKFFFIYALVLFAFACGLNQLLWYYADMEKQQCFSGPNGTENWTQQRDSCLAWRRFSNLFESSQTLFWASFGLVDLSNFELTGIKSYTRFWGLLMFGSYSVINVVVLLNLLIAMMSNSYNIISERADVEWKFARTTLFMNYFEEGNTAPPPFNIFPTCKHVLRLFKKQNSFKDMSIRRKQTKMKERDSIYQSVMCNLVWRYVTAEQKDTENHPVTEDNINELRQDVYSFRHELMRVLKNSGMKTRDIEKDEVDVTGKRVQSSKRRLIKDFSIGLMEVCTDEAAPEVLSNKSVLARFVGRSTTETRSSQRWKDLIQAAKRSKIIGNRDNGSIRFGSLKRNKSEEELSENKLRETMEMEFQKSEKFEHSVENKLYPNIPEEDLIKCTENTVAPIIIQPKVNLPLGSTEMPKTESCITNKDCLMKEIKLSPEALMKNVVKREKYQAPKPIVPSINEPTSPASKNIGNHSTKNAENIQNSTSKQNNVAINSNGKAVSNDTKITVTSSPEKILSPRNSSMTSVEIGNCQTLELIDLNKNQDSSTFYDISLTTNDNSNDISSSKPCFIDATKNGENNTKNALSDYPRTPQRNAAQFNRANDTQINLEGSKQVQQPPIFESKGWL